MRDRPYLFYELTNGVGSTCLRKVETTDVMQEGRVGWHRWWPIKQLMVSTNGIRIAQDEAFAARLAEYMPGFEVYLQFDSLEERPLRELRGVDLREVRQRALERLNRYNISTALVVTLKKGVNDGEIGRIIDFALKQRCVRGVTFQPVQVAGRLEDFDPERDRL